MRVEPATSHIDDLAGPEFLPSNAGDCGSSVIDPSGGLAAGHVARDSDFIGKCGMVLQTLSIYGAIGITSFGWALSRLLHFECSRYVPLWFCSALFIYNVDRLKTDPADLINIPSRRHSAEKLRGISRAIAAISAAALVLVPVLERDWLMLLLTTGGAVVCVNYSVPLLGFRFKDVPYLKSFFAPTLVTASFVVPPLLQQPGGSSPAFYTTVAAWTWCVTMFNMVLCDLRDIEGDANTGIRSLPVAIGFRRTIFVLVALLVFGVACSIAALPLCGAGMVAFWFFASLAMPFYLAGLLVALRRPVTEGFYEWWVEGILLVPALAFLISQ